MVAVKNWSKAQHFSWSASMIPASTGTSCTFRPLPGKENNHVKHGAELADVPGHTGTYWDILGQLAAVGQLVAPLDGPVDDVLDSRNGARWLLRRYFKPTD